MVQSALFPYLPINALKLCLNLTSLSVSPQEKSFLPSPQRLISKYQILGAIFSLIYSK